MLRSGCKKEVVQGQSERVSLLAANFSLIILISEIGVLTTIRQGLHNIIVKPDAHTHPHTHTHTHTQTHIIPH